MISATAEAGDFAGCVEAGNHIAVFLQHAAFEVGLQAAERLTGEDVELDGDEWAF